MKVCIIQPEYSTDYSRSDELFEKELNLLRACDESMDIIVMPEMCDIPALAPTKEQSEESARKYNQIFLTEAKKTAIRCNSMVFVNARSNGVKGLRNTTYAINRNGEIVGMYHKDHLVPNEVNKLKLDSDYSFEFTEPTVIEIEGIRFGFLICYDFYFYEAYAKMARQNLDVIIGCSHQRSDTHRALEIMTQFLAYNTNTYVLRSSVSMGEESEVGGASMVVAPDGEILCNMKSRTGLETVEIDVHDKYYKPAGFGNPPSAHYEYIEKGRRPWKYRPAGSAIVTHDSITPYPRVCANGGYSVNSPHSSMIALGSAVGMGADEIQLHLFETRDEKIITAKTENLTEISNGNGLISEKTYDELLNLDFGEKYGDGFKGLKVTSLEEVLKKFSCHIILNLNIGNDCTDECIDSIIKLIDKYDCRQYVYFTTSSKAVSDKLTNTAPDITRCLEINDKQDDAVERAISLGCKKIQFTLPYHSRDIINKAHENGIYCNAVLYGDASKYLKNGIDTLITDDCHNVMQNIKNN